MAKKLPVVKKYGNKSKFLKVSGFITLCKIEYVKKKNNNYFATVKFTTDI